MSGHQKVVPVRRVDDVSVVVEMRRHANGYFGRGLTEAEMEQGANRIARLIRSIVHEHDGYGPQVRVTGLLVCPECGYEWEIDPDDGLPACCTVAQASWRDTEQVSA